MKHWENELFQMMLENGFEIINIEDLGVELEATPVTHAILMEHWQTHEPCVSLTHGEPAAKYALYWDNSMDKNGKHDFENACKMIVELF